MAEYNLKDLKPVDRTFERDPSKGNLIQVTPVSALTAQNNPGTPLVIGQQYRPQIVSMNTNPVRKTVPIIPTQSACSYVD
jgi:hypothetical protein